ncbi:MAG: hypothetical protein E6Q97_26365 [Desulfurellales bacterium]|nr:MAG: hypothetical protein E6Q97_26365 [Desulfurellales bacterium]
MSSVAELQQQLKSGDTYQQAQAAHQLAEIAAADRSEIVVTRYDKYWQPAGEIGSYLQLQAGIFRNMAPSGEIILNGGDGYSVEGESAPDHNIPALENCRKELVGITIEVGALRWAGFVDYTDYNFQGGKRTLNAKLVGLFDLLNYIFVWPDPFWPIQAQPFSHAVYIGPIVSVIETMCSDQLRRIQSGLWGFLNNPAAILNPAAREWFRQLLHDNTNIFEALKTPIYLVRHKLPEDTSMLVARTVRMESLATVIADMTKAYGVDVRMDLWLPGDPQPDDSANLTQPTYVLTVTDRLTTEGKFGDIRDAIAKTVVDLQGSFFGEIIPLVQNAPGMDGVFISEVAGVSFEPPLAVLVDGPDTAMMEFKIHNHHPRAHTQIIGGRSPKWAGAPWGNLGGTGPHGLTLRKRSHQRHTRLGYRLTDDRHRHHRSAGEPVRRVPQRRVPRLSVGRKLWAQSGNGPVLTARTIHADSIRSI